MWWFALGAVLGCTPGPDESSESSYDQRIDFADGEVDPTSHDVRLCVGAQGQVYVAWLDDRLLPGTDDLWLNWSAEGGVSASWHEPVRINDRVEGDTASIESPALYCDGFTVALVWEDRGQGEFARARIAFDRSIDGGETWLDADESLDDDPESVAMSIQPRIVGAGSHLLVAWVDGRNGAYDIYATKSENAGLDWTIEHRLDVSDPAGASWSGAVDLALDPGNGRAFAVWEDTRAGHAALYVARSQDAGVTWEPDTPVQGAEADDAAAAFAPHVCTREGDVVVAWHDRPDGGGRRVWASTSVDTGTTFSAEPHRLDDPDTANADSLYPRCAATDDHLIVVWQDDRDGGFDAYARRITDGVPGAEERLDVGSPPGRANAAGLAIAADGSTTFVGWHDDRDAIDSGDGSGRYQDLYGVITAGNTAFPTDTDMAIDTHLLGLSGKSGLQVALTEERWWSAWIDDRYGTDDVWFRSVSLTEQ
jgi:hypothetical protein